MSKWKKINRELFYPRDKKEIIEISSIDLKKIKQIAHSNPTRKARYCAHKSVRSEIHEMIIFHEKGTYIRPHKHDKKSESYLLLNGEMDIILFNDIGKPIKLIQLGTINTNKTFFFRMPKPMYRTLIIKKDSVFLEVKRGPFVKHHVKWAKWAPDFQDQEKVRLYKKKLNNYLKSFK